MNIRIRIVVSVSNAIYLDQPTIFEPHSFPLKLKSPSPNSESSQLSPKFQSSTKLTCFVTTISPAVVGFPVVMLIMMKISHMKRMVPIIFASINPFSETTNTFL